MLQQREVVSCFLECRGLLLLLKRSQEVGSYRGQWATVSGYVEDIPPDEQALVELSEEVSLREADLRLVKKGEPLKVFDRKQGIRWIIHPYLFSLEDREKVCLDWEHEDSAWIDPAELDDYDTVPKLKESLAMVWIG